MAQDVSSGTSVEAHEIAGAALEVEGFSKSGKAEWVHPAFHVGPFSTRLRVQVPDDFPTRLPVAIVDRAALPHRLPHIEESGKLCLFPETGTLPDASRPAEIIRDVLGQARALLGVVDEGEIRRELIREFQSYWSPSSGFRALCLVDPARNTRAVSWLDLAEGGFVGCIAEDEVVARRWLHTLGLTASPVRQALYLPTETAFLPPDFGEELRLNDLLEHLKDACSEEVFGQLRDRLHAVELPTLVVLSLPGVLEGDRILAAVRIHGPSGDALKNARKGFRPDRVPRERLLNFARGEPVDRITVERVDPGFLVDRAGGSTDVLSKTAVVVGCGSVGSFVAESLAEAGVGCLRLIDPDDLEFANLYRHVVGARFIRRKKVDGLLTQLQERQPNLVVESRSARVEDVMKTEREFVTSADIVVVATGDEPTELRLNDELGTSMNRIHVWVEPLGLGGHVLTLIAGMRPGCYRCLFRHSAEYRFQNEASLARPGQAFQKSLAGCAGTFTPFGAVDARLAALDAVKSAIGVLVGRIVNGSLLTSPGDATAFLNAGFELSQRGQRLAGKGPVEVAEFSRSDCEACRHA